MRCCPPHQSTPGVIAVFLCTPALQPTGPVLPHLTGCSAFVRRIANCGTQLRSLSLSRYDLEDVSCVSAASQLTNLSLQHCSLTDDSLQVRPH